MPRNIPMNTIYELNDEKAYRNDIDQGWFIKKN